MRGGRGHRCLSERMVRAQVREVGGDEGEGALSALHWTACFALSGRLRPAVRSCMTQKGLHAPRLLVMPLHAPRRGPFRVAPHLCSKPLHDFWFACLPVHASLSSEGEDPLSSASYPFLPSSPPPPPCRQHGPCVSLQPPARPPRGRRPVHHPRAGGRRVGDGGSADVRGGAPPRVHRAPNGGPADR